MNPPLLRLLLLVIFSAACPGQAVIISTNGTALVNAFGASVAGVSDVDGDNVPDILVGVPALHENGSFAGAVRLVSGAGGGTLLEVPGFAAGESFGFAVADLGDVNGDGTPDFAASAPYASNSAGRVSVISGTDGTTLWFAIGTLAGDTLGWALARAPDADGDGVDDLLVGAPQIANALTGYAQLLSGSTGAVLQNWPGSAPGDLFGIAVGDAGDPDGDGTPDFIFGATGASGGGALAGRALVVSGATGALLHQWDGLATDALGSSVCGIGDVDGDLRSDLLVGAWQYGIGAGYIQIRSGATGAVLTTVNGTAPGDGFGWSVLALGDQDGDMIPDVAVGAPFQDVAGVVDAGSATVLSGVNGSVIRVLEGLTYAEWQGSSLARIGDLDMDGLEDFASGAPGALDIAGVQTGAVVVPSVGVSPTQLVVFGPIQGGAGYGRAVANAGDVDGDGTTDLIIGAPTDDPFNQTTAGSAVVRSGANGSLIWNFSGVATGDGFGIAVAGVGDTNGDGRDDILIGASTADPAGITSAGAAYLLSGLDGSTLQLVTGIATADLLGATVAGLGDLDQDGTREWAVAAIQDDAGGLDAGAVVVYSGATASPLYTFTGTAGDIFGFSMADAGDCNGDGTPDIVVGAPYADDGATLDTGRVMVLSGADGSVLLDVPGLQAGGLFGYSVAGVGDLDNDGNDDVLAAAPFASLATGAGAGQAVALSGANGAVLLAMDGQAPGVFLGLSVAGPGDVTGDGTPDLLVGIPFADGAGGTDAGQAVLYSGADGSVYAILEGAGPSDLLGAALAPVGDLDLNGRPDALVGAPGADPFGISNLGEASVWSLTPGPLASVMVLGAGCGGGPNLPTLSSTPPRLGSTVTLSITGVLPGAAGTLYVGAPALVPVMAGPCTVFLDVSTIQPALPVVADPTGNWSLPLPIPNDPALAGIRFDLQALTAPSTGPLAVDITNALTIVFGW